MEDIVANVRPGVNRPDDRRDRFRAYTAAELEEMDLSIRFLIRDAIAEGVPTVIGGASKSLKSSVALDAAVSIASGTPWLGHFPAAQQARVLYFAGEGGLTFIRDAIRRIATAKRLDPRDLDSLLLCDRVPALADDRDLAEVSAVIADHGAKVVFVDPLYLCLGGEAASASNLYAMGPIFRGLLGACAEVGATPIIVHHFRKSQQVGEEPSLADLSQAGVGEFAGGWVLVGRQAHYDEDRPGEHELTLRLGSRVGFSSRWALHVSEGSPSDPGGRCWQPTVSGMAEVRERREAEKDEARQRRQRRQIEADKLKIHAAMVAIPGGDTKTVIRTRAGIGPRYFEPAFAELLSDGDVVSCQIQKPNRGRPYDGFKLSS